MRQTLCGKFYGAIRETIALTACRISVCVERVVLAFALAKTRVGVVLLPWRTRSCRRLADDRSKENVAIGCSAIFRKHSIGIFTVGSAGRLPLNDGALNK